jgi:hypothetical protein
MQFSWLLALCSISAVICPVFGHPTSPFDELDHEKLSRAANAAVSDPSYWLAGISHQGLAAFNSNPSGYTVFRNVKDYGAKGYPI